MILIWVLAMIRRPSLRERLGEIAGLSAEAFQPVKDQLSPEGHVGIKTANLRANRAFVGTLRERIGELRFMRPDNAGQGSSASLASLALNSPDLANAVNLNNNASYGLQSSDPRARESVLIPQARISYNRELLGDDGGISATLGGVAANAVGAEQPKDTYRVGVGFTHLFSEASDSDSFFGHYEAEVTRDSTAHRITAGYRIKF